MRGRGGWTLAAALLVGLLPAAAPAADKDSDARDAKDSGTTSWFGRWFGPSDKKPEKKTVPADKKVVAKKGSETARPGMRPDQVAAEQAREEANLLRRLAVCDQLKQIAMENQDEALLRQAEELDKKAFAAYSQRVKSLSNAPVELADEKILEKHLGKSTPIRGKHEESAGQIKPPRDAGHQAAREEEP